MAVRFLEELRTFEIVTEAQSAGDNQVFMAQMPDPGTGQMSRFARFFPTVRRQWEHSVVVSLDDNRQIGSGEDPRLFIWRDSLCISAGSFHSGHGFINKVYVVAEDRWLTLIPPKKMQAGKNWMPFVADGQLYLVHQFSPFRVLRADLLHPNDGFLVLSVVHQVKNKTREAHDGFSRFRGGANALVWQGKLIGFGHTTDRMGDALNTLVHRPFFFVFDFDRQVTCIPLDDAFGAAMRIVDPTAFYQQGDRFFLVTSETEYEWTTAPQQGRSAVYEIDIEGLLHEDSIGSRGRGVHRWPDGAAPQKRRFLGAWRRR